MLFGLITFGQPKPVLDNKPIDNHSLLILAKSKVNDQTLKVLDHKQWKEWEQIVRTLGG